MTTTSRKYVNGKLVEGDLPVEDYQKPTWSRPTLPRIPVAEASNVIDIPVQSIAQPTTAATANEVVTPPQVANTTNAKPQDHDEITDTHSLRRFLLVSMQKAAKGELKSDAVKNICALTQQVYQATRLEIEVAKLTAEQRKLLGTGVKLLGDE